MDKCCLVTILNYKNELLFLSSSEFIGELDGEMLVFSSIDFMGMLSWVKRLVKLKCFWIFELLLDL